ncbi:hypothetical protein COI97_16100 [Bacillus cereus]|nr:hypothetical protein COI97_16100 [Bacillus cereus]
MQPILYPSNEIKFEGLGLGVITNIETCLVTEEFNGMFELEMSIEKCDDSPLVVIPKEDQIILAKSSDFDNGQAFRVYDVDKDDDFSIFIRARHVSFDAKYHYVSSIVKTDYSANAAMETIMSRIEPKSHPFRLSTDLDTISKFESMFKGLDEVVQGTRGSLLDVYGGELTRDNWHVRYNKRRGSDTDIVIAAGKNLTGISVNVNTDDVFTRIVPFAKKNTEGSDEEYIYLPERFVDSPYINDYPKPRIKAVEIQDVETEAQLRSKASTYFVRNKTDVPKMNAKIGFVPLWEIEGNEELAGIERLHVGDRVTGRHPDITPDLTARVVKTIYDSINERYDSIELGDAKASITSDSKNEIEDIRESIETDRSSWKNVVDMVTDKITGNDGGHVVLHPRLNPQEIFIMNTDSVNTATQVLRLNKNGIGFSKNGINGPFETAWTVDGVFIADFIKAGTLDGNLLKVGVIKGQKGNMVIDLNNDVLDIKNGAISITRPDGYKLINNGQANFDFAVGEASPAFIGGEVDTWNKWLRTRSQQTQDAGLFSFRHQARYFKLKIGVGLEAGNADGAGFVIFDQETGKVVADGLIWEWVGDNNFAGGIRELTVDMGKPDGRKRSVSLAFKTNNPNFYAYIRKVEAWLEG